MTIYLGFLWCASAAVAHTPPLLPTPVITALADEVSGETAKTTLEGITRFHRQRGSQGFHAAAQIIAEQAKGYGLQEVQILRFPADGQIAYGTQVSRRSWDASEAELSEVTPAGERLVASYRAEPTVLAEDSESADVIADVVDVGAGTHEADYAGHDVRGKLVLVAAQPGEVQDLAVGQYGAAGIVSYAQNQKTAWSGDDDSLIRWGHLGSFSDHPTFAFMVSLKTARALQEKLRTGQTLRFHAMVKAGQHAGAYEIVTAVIPGVDPALKEQEIALSCHLDHQRPGANDNASGCVTVLEVARTLQRLIDAGRLARPTRTLRFIWPPEIEGTVTLLNARPDLARRIRAVIHMDMVGGGSDTKAVFHMTRGPASLPSFVHDVGWAFASWLNQETYEYAASNVSQFPMIAPEGGKEPLRAMYSGYTMGSDHDVYQDSSFRIPSIYMNDWPDRYIHTNKDSAANIDTTKLKRAAFIGAASGYFLANLTARDIPAVERSIANGRLMRAGDSAQRGSSVEARDAYERGVEDSVRAFLSLDSEAPAKPRAAAKATGDGQRVFRRAATPKGPLAVFGYDYLAAHAKNAGLTLPGLLDYAGEWGGGEEYAYEALNFADGTRTAQQIASALSAEYGPVPLELVVKYLNTLRKIGVVER